MPNNKVNFKKKAEIIANRKRSPSTLKGKSRGKKDITIPYQHYQDLPVDFINKELGLTIWDKQIEIANSLCTDGKVLVRASHAVGKSYLLGALISWGFYCFPNSIGVLTAPTYNQAQDVGFGYARTFIEQSNLPDYFKGPRSPELQSKSNHLFKAISAANSNSVQGRHGETVHIFLDESVGINHLLQDAFSSLMIGNRVHALHLYNPTDPSAHVYNLESNPDWKVITISCFEHPNIAHGEKRILEGKDPSKYLPYPGAIDLPHLNTLIRQWSAPIEEREYDPVDDIILPGTGIGDIEPQYYRPGPNAQSRLLGKWPTTGTSTVITEGHFSLIKDVEWIEDPEVISLGVDVARQGNDLSVLTTFVGNGIEDIETYQIQDTMQVTGQVVATIKQLSNRYKISEYAIPIPIDIIGYGSGVYDRLAELGYDVIPVNTSERASEYKKYVNLRTELIFNFQHLLKKKTICFRTPTLMERARKQFVPQQYTYDSNGRFALEAKLRLKQRIGISPDIADSILLALSATPYMQEISTTWDYASL